MSRIGNGYSGCWVDADYGSASQKWFLIHSEQATKREEETFYKNLDKNITKELKVLGQLMKKQFACVVDAEQAMSDFAGQCHLLGYTQPTIVKEPSLK